MSNLDTISENFCAIANLKHFILCAFPNFLVLGKPLKTVTGIKFEKKTYFKIRSCDFETWFNNLNGVLDWFTSNEIDVESLTILEEPDLKYSMNCVVVNNEKQLQIKQNQNGDELIFEFDHSELKMFMLAFADLMMHVFCFPDNVMELFYHMMVHFMSFQNCSVEVDKRHDML